MKIELACCTSTILAEIKNKKSTRDTVAQIIKLALSSDETTDWSAVNKAITDRWSQSAREYIFNQAWKGIE